MKRVITSHSAWDMKFQIFPACCYFKEKWISDSFKIEKNMIVVTVFLFIIMNPREFCSAHNQRENCHYDHIHFNLKVIINLVLCMYASKQGNVDSYTYICVSTFPETFGNF